MKDSILIQELLEELSTVTIDGIKSVHDDAIDMVSQLDQNGYCISIRATS